MLQRPLDAAYGRVFSGPDDKPRASRVWPYIAGCTLLSCLAVAAATPYQLAALTGINMLLAALAGVRVGFARKVAKVIVLQAPLIVLLYQLRFGIGSGIMPGLIVSWRMALAFLPGLIFMSAVPQHRVVEALSGLLPYRVAFVIGATMMFLPRLVSDIREIYQTQALRGARVLPRDMLFPSGWRDAVGCVLVPSIVRAMSLAHEISLAAQAREFGISKSRTSWPGE